MYRILLATLPILIGVFLSGCGSIVNQLSGDPQPFGGPACDVAMASHLGQKPMDGKQALGAVAFLFGDMAMSCATDLVIYGVIVPLWHRHDDDFPVAYIARVPVQTGLDDSSDPMARSYSVARGRVVDGSVRSPLVASAPLSLREGDWLDLYGPLPAQTPTIPSSHKPGAESHEPSTPPLEQAAFVGCWIQSEEHGPAGGPWHNAPVTMAMGSEPTPRTTEQWSDTPFRGTGTWSVGMSWPVDSPTVEVWSPSRQADAELLPEQDDIQP
jgi:hypothetical protein